MVFLSSGAAEVVRLVQPFLSVTRDVHVTVAEKRRHDDLLRQRVHGQDHHGVGPAGVVVLPGVHAHDEHVVKLRVREERTDIRGHVAGQRHVEEVGQFLRVGRQVEAGRRGSVFGDPRQTLRTRPYGKGAGRRRRHHQADGEERRKHAFPKRGFHSRSLLFRQLVYHNRAFLLNHFGHKARAVYRQKGKGRFRKTSVVVSHKRRCKFLLTLLVLFFLSKG